MTRWNRERSPGGEPHRPGGRARAGHRPRHLSRGERDLHFPHRLRPDQQPVRADVRAAYHGLPFLLAVAFALIAALPHNAPGAGVAAFCLAGLGCSALLPLTISFGQEKLASCETAVAGGVIACYQGGYGVAAFGVGPLVSAGVRVPEIFAASAVVAGLMGLFSFAVARGRPSPATLHPRPMPVRVRREAR